ncbi:hypothetical protein GGR58DRAFT_480361 [Xylaria digitata]|nr:hypothetical protein GGR58DRAFT_480361 [Xylaria digitata]
MRIGCGFIIIWLTCIATVGVTSRNPYPRMSDADILGLALRLVYNINLTPRIIHRVLARRQAAVQMRQLRRRIVGGDLCWLGCR